MSHDLSPKTQNNSHRPSYLRIDLAALAANFREVEKFVAPARVMPILKANAYGHGLVECARVFEALGAECLAVAFLEEALELRLAGIKCRILALGGICGRQVEQFLQYDIDSTASSLDKLKAIEECAARLGREARVHLKFDTGMERIGVHYYNAHKLIEAAAQCRNCQIVAVYSHLACAEEEDQAVTREQVARFEAIRQLSLKTLSKPPKFHLANSAGLLKSSAHHYDFVRPGALLYGVTPAPYLAGLLTLQPVMSLRSEVAYFKVVEAGVGVSYGHTWRSKERCRIVTVPLGYGDGYLRALSNKAEVLIRGKRYPIVGRVCMDQFMVNIAWDEAFNGEEVVLIGSQGNEEIEVEELAEMVGTDVREVLSALNVRLPRVYV